VIPLLGLPRRRTLPASRAGRLALAAAVVSLWWALYLLDGPFWDLLLHDAIGLDPHGRPGSSVRFFCYDTVKIFLLLTGLMFVIGMLRTGLDPQWARDRLSGHGLLTGLVLAVVLGIVTPFCSCSSVPLFIGFVAAGIPAPVTLTFLLASPLVSEVAAVVIGDRFGWDVAAAYVLAGSGLALAIGAVLSRFRLERWIEDTAFATRIGNLRAGGHVPTADERVLAALEETRDILSRVWVWVLVGVGTGAVIHGWVPQDFFVEHVGAGNPLAVPLAALLGAPLYVNGAGAVPIAEALWSKGVPLGTVMALTMSSIALSVPEAIMLRRVLKPPLLALFFGSVTLGIIAVGYLFNVLYG